MPFSRAKAFVTTSNLFATGHPLVEPAPIMPHGAFLGYYLGSGKSFYLDLTQLMALGLVHSLIIFIYGMKDSGKSTLLKDLVLKIASLQTGPPDNGCDEDMPSAMIRINDRKPNREKDNTGTLLRGEYAALADYLLADTIQLAEYGRFNPFDSAILTNVDEIVDMAATLTKSALGRPLRDFEGAALEIAIRRMLKDNPTQPSLDQLSWNLASPHRDDVRGYFSNPGSTVANSDLAILNDSRIYSAYLEDSTRTSAATKLIQGGTYGNLFGNEKSLYEVLNRDILNLDWTGVSGDGGDLLETLIYKLQAIGLRKRLPINPTAIVSDEEGTRIKNPVHAASFAQFVREARAYETISLQATQFSTDLDNLGEKDSSLRKIGREIDMGIGVRIYGRQPATPDIIESIMRQGISHSDALATTLLPQGCWAIKLPDKPVQFFQHRVASTQVLEIVETNRANKRVSQRRTVSEMPYIKQRIHKIWPHVMDRLTNDPAQYSEIRSYVQREIGEEYDDGLTE